MTPKSASTPHTDTELCPISAAIRLVGDRWTLLIIRQLAQGEKRFGDLLGLLDGISTRTLTLKLKQLEENHLIIRTAYQERPPRVVYALSPEGEEMTYIIDALGSFGKRYLKRTAT